MWDKVPVVRVDGGGLKPAAVSLLCVFLGVVECRGVCSWKSGLNPVGRRDALHRILAGPESRLNIKRRHSLIIWVCYKYSKDFFNKVKRENSRIKAA